MPFSFALVERHFMSTFNAAWHLRLQQFLLTVINILPRRQLLTCKKDKIHSLRLQLDNTTTRDGHYRLANGRTLKYLKNKNQHGVEYYARIIWNIYSFDSKTLKWEWINPCKSWNSCKILNLMASKITLAIWILVLM